MNATQITSAKTAELVAAYNAAAAALGEKTVARFADRKSAERRATDILARAAASNKTAKRTAKTAIAKASASSRSEAIARSWTVPATAAKRSERTSVIVTGPDGNKQSFTSVAKAFEEFGLPMAKHIPFRMALKAAGKNAIEGYKFRVEETK